MADDTDTPDAPTTDAAKPAPRRRAAPRKTAGDAPKPRAASARANKGVVAQAEDAATKAVTGAKDAVTGAAGAAVAAVKPRSTSRGKAAGAKAPAKRAPAKRSAKTAESKSGSGWTTAAIAGGVAAAGAAVVAGVLTLRGSTAKNLGTEKKPIDISGSGDKGQGHPQTVTGASGAHQPDGTDSSASFKAGIADENTVPDAK